MEYILMIEFYEQCHKIQDYLYHSWVDNVLNNIVPTLYGKIVGNS